MWNGPGLHVTSSDDTEQQTAHFMQTCGATRYTTKCQLQIILTLTMFEFLQTTIWLYFEQCAMPMLSLKASMFPT